MVRVCFVCSSKRRLQRCLTVWNQRSFHRLIVKLQLPIFLFPFITDTYSSLHLCSIFFFLFSIWWKRGKRRGEKREFQHCRKSQHRNFIHTGFPCSLYTKRHVTYTTQHVYFLMFVLLVCFFVFFVCFFKATARCCEAPDGKQKFTRV